MLERFHEANAAFVARRRTSPSAAPAGHGSKLVIVSCMEPIVESLLPEALGIAPGEAYHIRNAGNTCTRWDESIIRSVAVAVLSGGIRHVAVVGHTDCRMAGDLMPILDAMRQGGIPRDVFGDRDPREWFGMIAGIESNVRNVLEALKRSPLLPGGVSLYGLILDTETGAMHALGSETTAGPPLAAEVAPSDHAPRRGDTLEQILGAGILSSLVPKAGEVPIASSPPTADATLAALAAPSLVAAPKPAPPPPAIDGTALFREPTVPSPLRDIAARQEPAPQPESGPPRPARANVRRDEGRDRERERERERVPLDPRAAQEFFRKRELERLRRKRREHEP